MKNITFASIFDSPTAPESNTGSEAQIPDGRIYVYKKTSEAITKSMIVTRPANTDVDTVSSSTNSRSQIVFITEASAGWTVGTYQDYWGLVDDGTGEGESFKVKDNTADTLELYEDYRLATALDVASSDIVLVAEPVVEKSAVNTLLTMPVGVAPITFASGDYGWFLRRGIGGVLMNGVATINELVSPGGATEGHATALASGETIDDVASVGRVLVANTTDGEEVLLMVNCW